MTTQLGIGIRATPHHVALKAHVNETIEAALKARHAPPTQFYRYLIQRDVVAIAVAMLVPSGLSGVIPFTSERLTPFRLANLLDARVAGRESIPVDIGSLREQGTVEARKCLACIPGGLKWSRASHDERKLILAATFLRARAWGIAS